MDSIWTQTKSDTLDGSLISVNSIKDTTKYYDDIINGFDFYLISCFLVYQNVEIITQKSSTIGTKIKFARSNRVKFDNEQISEPESVA